MATEWVNDIHQGDAGETLAEMPESSVHMCMTSPPYWNLRDYGEDGQLGLEKTAEEYVNNIAGVCEEIYRVLREDGSLWLNLGDTYDNKDLQQIPARVSLELQARGWTLRNRVTWAKPNPMPQSVKDRLNDTTEAIFHFVKNKHYWYDLDAIREPHIVEDASRKNSSEWVESTENNHNGKRAGGHPLGKNPGDVFEVTTKPFPDAHFAVYPPELCKKPIQSSCPPKVCSECGTPYERRTETIPMWERDESTIEREQTKRGLELANEHALTDKHFKAAQAVGLGDSDSGDGKPYERVSDATERLARETENALGSYCRELLLSEPAPTDEWEQTCNCETDETEAGIVLDPFSGAGTTALVAKDLGRRFVGIELNPEYVAMSQKRVGITVDEPERLLSEDETSLEAFADGGNYGD